MLVLTVNIDMGDLPLRTAFPILITNALNWFTGDKGELQEAIPAGELARVNLAGVSCERTPMRTWIRQPMSWTMPGRQPDADD